MSAFCWLVASGVCVVQSCAAYEEDGETCSACQYGYGLVSGTECQSCLYAAENCRVCSRWGDASQCQVCFSGYKVDGSSSKCVVGTETQTWSGPMPEHCANGGTLSGGYKFCLECERGYYSFGNVLSGDECRQCTTLDSHCKVCDGTYSNYGAHTGGDCTECEDGYRPSSQLKKCHPCKDDIPHCVKCSQTRKACTS